MQPKRGVQLSIGTADHAAPHDLSSSCTQTSPYDTVADSKLNTLQWLRATVQDQVSSWPGTFLHEPIRLATPRGPGPISPSASYHRKRTLFFGHLRSCATNWLTYRSLMCKNYISLLYPATDPWILEVLLAMTEPVCHSCTHYEG